MCQAVNVLTKISPFAKVFPFMEMTKSVLLYLSECINSAYFYQFLIVKHMYVHTYAIMYTVSTQSVVLMVVVHQYALSV